MKPHALVWIAVLLAGLAACSDDGPAGTAGKELVFVFSAPSSVPTKQSVELEVRWLAGRGRALVKGAQRCGAAVERHGEGPDAFEDG